MPEPLSQDNFDFDYTQFDRDTSRFLQGEAGKIKGLLTQTIESIVEIGNSLIEVKKSLKYGLYRQWLHAEFEMSIRTADNFTRVAKCFNDANFSELDIAKSALYLLAAPSVPDEAREEALEMAKKGRVSQKKAAELIEFYKDYSEKTLPDLPPIKTKPGKRRRLTETTKKDLAKGTKLSSSENKQVRKGEIWSLGRYHRLFCGDPSSLKFRTLIPDEIALVIQFTDTLQGWPKNIPSNSKSAIACYTSLGDFHFETLRRTIESYILGTADSDEVILLIGLPDPALFILLDQLECSCICAETDPNICSDAIAAWTITTKRQARKL